MTIKEIRAQFWCDVVKTWMPIKKNDPNVLDPTIVADIYRDEFDKRFKEED